MRKFRWLFVSLLVAAALCATMFFTACGGPPGLVDWQLQRTFPHLAITIREMQWHGTGDLEVRHVEIRNRENRVLMGRVESIRITFGLRGVFSSRLSSLEIRNPVFWVTPDFVSAVEKTLDDLGGNGDAGAGREWQVDHARCDFGQFVIRNVPNEGLYGSLRFALDWKGLGNTPETLMNFHQLVVWGISVSDRTDFSHPFFTLDLLKAGFTIPRLLERRNIEEITVTGGTFRADHETFELLATPSKDDGESGEATPRVPEEPVGWIGKLSIANFVVDLDEPVPDAGAGFVFTLNTSLQNVPMGGVLHAVGSETQQVELANIEILSPLDPLVRVISLRSVFVYFSIDGLLERKLQRVIVLSPTLYLSQDFFLYMQTMREALDARTGTADRQEPDGPSWIIEEFRVEFGRLVLGGERRGHIGLPLAFQTRAQDVQFDDLASLRLVTALSVEPQSFAFPALQLELERLRGNLRLSYPPQTAPDNLVNELYLDGLRWRQFTANELWLSATLDAQGAYASLGGRAYGGYVNAGLTFSFGGESRWVGWVAGTDIDLRSLTDVLFPQNLQLTGPASFTVEVDARASRIDRVKGMLQSPGPGSMKISKIDELLERIPEDWGVLRQSVTKSALETIRDFEFSTAKADFWYIEEQGRLTLRLPGPHGSRNLDLFLHADETSDGLWKQPERLSTTQE